MNTRNTILVFLVATALCLAATVTHAGEIHDAVEADDLKKVEALIKADPSLVNMKDGDMTPLNLAAEFGHKDMVKLLLAYKADVNAKAQGDWTPLHRAARGHKEMVELLLSSKAEVNAKATDGSTPLHWAALYGRKDIAELLLYDKADVNAKCHNGKTPLHWMARNCHRDVAEVLLAHKADVNAKTVVGETPLSLALEGRRDFGSRNPGLFVLVKVNPKGLLDGSVWYQWRYRRVTLGQWDKFIDLLRKHGGKE